SYQPRARLRPSRAGPGVTQRGRAASEPVGSAGSHGGSPSGGLSKCDPGSEIGIRTSPGGPAVRCRRRPVRRAISLGARPAAPPGRVLPGSRGGLRELIGEYLDARAGDLRVLLAGTAADPHAADDLAVDDHGHAAVERRDLAAAGRRGVLEADVEQGVRIRRPGRQWAALLAAR